MLKKIKLRYLTFASSLIFIILISYLILKKGENKLIDYPISTFGNIEQNFFLFILGSFILLTIFTNIITRLYNENNVKIRWWIYLIPIFGIITVIIPYRNDNVTYKQLHTLFAVICSSLILLTMHIYNKHNNEKNKIIKKINSLIPIISLIGTLTLFLFTGINTIMQIFYLSLLIYWINQVSYKY
jgi:hypothetical protein